MASEILSIQDVKNQIGITNIDEHKWKNATYVALSTIRTGLAMSGVIKAGTVASTMMGVASIIAPVAAFVAALCAIGLPVARAKEIVSKKGARHGYAIGLTLAAFGYGKYFASTFIDHTSGSPGVAPSFMTGVYKTAYNASLVLGYCAGNELKADEKNQLTNQLTGIMIGDAQKGNYKINIDAWSDRDWVHNYARYLNNNLIKE
jgi:hypothetical protein